MLENPTTGRNISAASRLLRALLERVKLMKQDITTVTYGYANRTWVQMDSINTRKLGLPLDVVHETCIQNGLPDLAALVVRSDTGRPGERYCLNASWEREIEKIRNYPWDKVGTLFVTLRVKMS